MGPNSPAIDPLLVQGTLETRATRSAAATAVLRAPRDRDKPRPPPVLPAEPRCPPHLPTRPRPLLTASRQSAVLLCRLPLCPESTGKEMERQPPGGAAPSTAMDYSLAALKIFGSQLAGATEADPSEGPFSAQMLFGIRFQRAWIQGVLVHVDYSIGGGRLFLDDGSCVIELMLQTKDAEGQPWRPGMYVLIIGAYVAHESLVNLPMIKVHKIVDLSGQPDREAMWYMEVAEAYNFFYSARPSAASSPS